MYIIAINTSTPLVESLYVAEPGEAHYFKKASAWIQHKPLQSRVDFFYLFVCRCQSPASDFTSIPTMLAQGMWQQRVNKSWGCQGFVEDIPSICCGVLWPFGGII